MEYAPGGDLLEYIRERNGISEDEARWFFQQLIIGLDYCHRMGVMNRDIKLENTLLDDKPWPLVKICDFGYSKHEKQDSAPKSLVGTRPYLAPELIMAKKGETYDGKKADIWCCGVLLYVMMFGMYPFERPGDDLKRDSPKILKRIENVQYNIPKNIVSEDCEDLIKKIMVKDSNQRLSIQDIQQHPWYLHNLPKGALTMNKTLENNEGVGLQSIEEIKEIFNEARQVYYDHI